MFVAILTDATEVSAFMNEDRYMGLINVLRFAGVVVHSVVWSSRGRELVQGSVPADFAINLSGKHGRPVRLDRGGDRFRCHPAAARGRHGGPLR